MQAEYFQGWKTVVRTDGKETQDSISFPSLKECPYQFTDAYNGSLWAALNSTMVYLKTGNESLTIAELLENQQPINDVIGVWWQTGWEGMGSKPLRYPIVIPPNQKAIIQINHIATENISIINSFNVVYNETLPSNPASLAFEEVNPTKYVVKVEIANQPFLLIFSESYDPQWHAYLSTDNLEEKTAVNYPFDNVTEFVADAKLTPQDISYLFGKPVAQLSHVTINGFANAWYVNPAQFNNTSGSFTITLYYLPQSYDYLGLLVSSLTLIAAVVFLVCTLTKLKFLKRSFLLKEL